jgi:hypothetical protein
VGHETADIPAWCFHRGSTRIRCQCIHCCADALHRYWQRCARITTISLWSALAVVTWWISPPLPLYVLIHVGAIWLVRSLYFYAGALPALFDLGLSALSISAFIWAVSRTGSVFLATWCFFLVQALFVVIPATLKKRPREIKAADNGSFERASRQADKALRLLINH